MRHGRAGFKLGRVTAHRWALFRNLLVALFRHERIVTTVAKAKAVRGLADQMVTALRISTTDLEKPIQFLSGGNQFAITNQRCRGVGVEGI